MRNITILLIFCLLCIPITVQGGTPVTIHVTGSPEWIVVGGEQAKLTVEVTNGAGTAINGATVTATSLEEAANMGSIAGPATATTNANGLVYVNFQSNTRSGQAPIRITVIYSDSTGSRDNQVTYYQKVDHDIPRYYGLITYPFSGIVASNISMTVTMQDRFGNPVDNLREKEEGRVVETIRYATSIESDGSIWDGITYTPGIHQFSQPVNEQADSSIRVQLGTHIQTNYVHVTAPPSVLSNQTGRNDIWLTIKGIPDIPDSISSTITSQFEPDPLDNHQASADGVDRFSLIYTAYDRYGNPVPGIILDWTTSRGESRAFVTNLDGRAFVEYGPSTEIQTVFINVSNQTPAGRIWRNDTVIFVEGGPSIFTVAANPFTLASRDVRADSSALILARVMDDMGRAIPGETVVFRITSDDSTPDVVSHASFDSDDPANQSITVTTNTDGYALVVFYPGRFPTFGEEEYSPSSTGSAVIEATWTSETSVETRMVTISYMNFPYIRAETFVDPPTAEVNESVNITIRLIGEGFAPYAPVDAVLCTNRGESMLKDMYYLGEKGAFEDKMVYLYDAAIYNFTKLFRDEDRVGVVSFGIQGTTDLAEHTKYNWPGDDSNNLDTLAYLPHYKGYWKTYADYATRDLELTHTTLENQDVIENTIREITPSKDPRGTVLVPIRYGLYQSITMLNQSGGNGAVKAVVLLSDSDWTAYGDPLAGWDGSEVKVKQAYWPEERAPEDFNQGGTGQWTAFHAFRTKSSPLQNMANYARASDVKIFTIAYFKKGSIIPTKLNNTLDTLATSTGGMYFRADSGEQLSEIFGEIAELLKKYAGVNTRMDLDLTNVSRTYNDTIVYEAGYEVFNYTHTCGVSTYVDSWTGSGETKERIPDGLPVDPYPDQTCIPPVNGNITYPYTYNQTEEWLGGHLNFHVGNISIGQTWEATFQLVAKKPGYINLFTLNPGLCFTTGEDGEDCVPLPKTIVTAVWNVTNETRGQNTIDVLYDSINASLNPSTDLIDLSWDVSYSGPFPVRQTLSYQYSSDGVNWETDWIDLKPMMVPGHGPYDPANTIYTLDLRERSGFIRVTITACEWMSNHCGVSDKEVKGPFDIRLIRGPTIQIQ